VAGSFEHGNKPSGSKKGREIFNWLSEYQRLNTDSAPWSYSGCLTTNVNNIHDTRAHIENLGKYFRFEGTWLQTGELFHGVVNTVQF
jgi:hypothetical protein